MSYAKTVGIAIGLCTMVLFLFSILHALVPVLRGSATGIGIVWRGVIESLIASILLGWIAGTVWYFARR